MPKAYSNLEKDIIYHCIKHSRKGLTSFEIQKYTCIDGVTVLENALQLVKQGKLKYRNITSYKIKKFSLR